MDKTQITTIAYNANAQAYADKFMEHKSYVEQVLEFARYLSDGDTVLDVGCGPGNVAKHLLSTKAITVTGIDLSDEMVALARKNAPSGTFFVQDSRFADYPAAHFDTVVLSFSIVHLNDEEAYQLIDNAVYWMKRKGFLYLSFMKDNISRCRNAELFAGTDLFQLLL